MCKSNKDLMLKLQSLINRYRGAENFVYMMDEWPKTIRTLVFSSTPLMIRLGMLMPIKNEESDETTEKIVEDILAYCRNGEHNLITVFSEPSGAEATSIRWCTVCGSVVGDLDYGGRTHPGRIFKMKFPEIKKQTRTS